MDAETLLIRVLLRLGDPSENWESAYQHLLGHTLPPYIEFEVLRYGASSVRQAQLDLGRSPQFRRREIRRLKGQFDLAAEILASVDPETFGDQDVIWMKAYRAFLMQDFDEARALFESSYQELKKYSSFLVDFGRLQYATGHTRAAKDRFLQALAQEDPLDPISTFQAYLWLARVYRLHAHPDDELLALEQLGNALKRYKSTGVPVPERAPAYHDIAKAKECFVIRMSHALVERQRHDDAYEFTKEAAETWDADLPFPVTAVEEALEALTREQRWDEARAWATKWAAELKTARPLAKFEALRGYGFSASMQSTQELIQRLMADTELITGDYHTPYGEYVSRSTFSRGLFQLLREAESRIEMDLREEALEILYATAFHAFDLGDATFVCMLLHVLNLYTNVFPITGRISEIFKESSARYPRASYVLTECAEHSFKMGDLDQALVQINTARKLIHKPIAKMEALLAEIYARQGRLEIAQSILDKAIEDARHIDIVSAYRHAVRWATEAGIFDLSLRWANGFLERVTGIKTLEGADEIYEHAGMAALTLGRYREAAQYYEWLLIYRVHRYTETPSDSFTAFAADDYVTTQSDKFTPFTKDALAQANLLWALAAILDGNLTLARERLAEAQDFESRHLLMPGVEALLALKEGNILVAVQMLLENELPDWQKRIVGEYALDRAAKADVSSEIVERLRWEVRRLCGAVPDVAELAAQLARESRLRSEAQQHAEKTHRTYLSMLTVVRTLLEQLPLRDEDQKARDLLILALESGANAEDAIEQYVTTLVAFYKSTPAPHKILMAEEAWQCLDLTTQERIVTASLYVADAEISKYDLGPALVTLTAGLEHLIDLTITEPLTQHFVAQKKLHLLRRKRIKLDRVALGQLDEVLRGCDSKEHEYGQERDLWLQKTFDERNRHFIQHEFLDIVTEVSKVRNNWVHGGVSVDVVTFERQKDLLFHTNYGAFVRLSQILRQKP